MARTPIHPGEHLADDLDALGMSASAFAAKIDVPVNRITAILILGGCCGRVSPARIRTSFATSRATPACQRKHIRHWSLVTVRRTTGSSHALRSRMRRCLW
jgi:hypothetical protein